MARIELSNIGGGGGTALTLTTTGTSGAATLAGSVLNIPVYQGHLTLTTTGTSGAATLSGDVLNIPQYSGGGGTPAGSTGEIQYNNAGAFAASANLAWDNANVRLNIGAPSSPTARLNVKGGGTTSATINTRITDSGNTELFRINDDGSSLFGGNITLSASRSVILTSTGTNRNSSIVSASAVDNFGITNVYPPSGTNVGSAVQIVPRGTGYSSGIKSQIGIFNTDFVANPSAYEFMSVRAAGDRFTIASGHVGLQVRPILISAGFADGSTNSNQLWINTNGTVSLNKTSTNYQLDVTAASTFDGFRVVGSSSASGRVALQVQSSTATLYNIDNDGKISYLATNTAAGTTGPQTINRPSGTVNFGIGASSLVVTNSLCTTASIVLPVIRTNDATATIKNVVPAAGSFTINLSAAATAETSVGFFIIN